MSLVLGCLLLFVLLLPLLFALRRSTELFQLRVRAGRTTHVRGRIPRSLLQDISDILKRPAVSAGEVKAILEDGRPTLSAKGDLSETQLQQLRNVLGRFSLTELRTGAPARRPRVER